MQVVVLSDTHAPRRWRSCPARVAEQLRGADLILHAGDVCVASVLTELAQYAPVVAVLGNNDAPDVAGWGAAETAELDLAGLNLAMVHDSGPAPGRMARLHRRFPAADLVVFGHSHIPLDAAGPGLRIFNPGSPTDRRRQPHGTLGVLRIAEGRLLDAAIVPVTLFPCTPSGLCGGGWKLGRALRDPVSMSGLPQMPRPGRCPSRWSPTGPRRDASRG